MTGPTAPAVKSLDDLSGHEIRVRPSSSYYGSLAALNKTLAKPIKITAIDENLEDEDLMEMVSAGLLPWVVVRFAQGEALVGDPARSDRA